MGPLMNNMVVLNQPRTVALQIPDPGDTTAYLQYLANDQQFLNALAASMGPNHISAGAPDAYRSIIDAAAANVGNLSPEERAQIIQQARTIPAAGYRSDPAQPAGQIVKNIERMSNNQGYTGPGAGVVVANTPTASGGTNPVTRGQVMDNENFGNLVNSVFTAAGGKSSMPAGLQFAALARTGMPGDVFNAGGTWRPLSGIDMSKWSEGERVAFLNRVAEVGKDGVMSAQEQGELDQLAAGYSNNADNEPVAVTSTSPSFFGKSGAIGNDDLMENGSFEKQLNSIALWGADANGAEATALKDAIARANYDELSYDERVALIQAFNAATADSNVTAQEITALTQMIEDFQKPASTGAASSSGTTLSNGLVIDSNDVRSGDNFVSMVNSVLDRSGVTTANTSSNGTTCYGFSPFSSYQSTVPILRSLPVADLTPQQRIEVLEMISQAASDQEITRDEVNAISTRVNELSGRGSQPFFMA